MWTAGLDTGLGPRKSSPSPKDAAVQLTASQGVGPAVATDLPLPPPSPWPGCGARCQTPSRRADRTRPAADSAAPAILNLDGDTRVSRHHPLFPTASEDVGPQRCGLGAAGPREPEPSTGGLLLLVTLCSSRFPSSPHCTETDPGTETRGSRGPTSRSQITTMCGTHFWAQSDLAQTGAGEGLRGIRGPHTRL